MSNNINKFIISLSSIAVLLSLPGCRMQTVPTPARVPAPAPAAPAVQPRPMSWRVASAYLEDIFAAIPNSSIDDFRKDTPEQERARINAAHGEEGLKESNAHVYGEPSPLATDLMLRRLGVGADDVVYDLGCGRAFFLMQALLTTPVRKAVGVELATSRIDIARLARQKMLDQDLLRGKILDLREQDMAETDLDDATVVFMDSVFFSDRLLGTVARNMARARNLRAVVMITKGLPANPWFELEGKERLKMSWSPRFGSDVLFFKRTAAPAD